MKWRITFVGFLASMNFLSGCSREETSQNPATPVGVTAVQMYESGNEIRYSANIVPYAQVDLAFKSGGYVETIRQVKGADGRTRDLQQGDRVSKGMILAQVRQEDYVIKVDQAKTQLAQAKWSLESAKSQLSKAEAALNHSQLDFARAKNLFETQSLTKSDFDTATTRLDTDQANVAAAKSQVDALQAQVGTAEQAVKSAELALADATLKSPMDGVVLARSIEIGTLATPGATAFVLADVSSVKAVFGVPDTMMDRVKLGTRQTITAEAVPGKLEGLITAISPSADPKSRTFSVEVTIPNPRERINAGMIATLTLAAARPAAQVPVIPLSAVIRSTQSPDGYAVFVIEDQAGKSLARMRNVELGEAYGNMIGVKAGLNLGERVITTGATLIRDGWQVQVIR